MSLRLNLGCSTTCERGYLNVDLWTPAWAAPDNFLQVNLSASWPWEDSSVDEIRAHDIIEHLPDKMHTMNEIHRVLRHGGLVDILVPTTDGRGAWQDPTHVSFWNRNSFFYWTEGNPHYHRFREAYGMKGSFVVESAEHERDQAGVVKLRIIMRAVKNQESLSWEIWAAKAAQAVG